ncbi:MAG: 4-hydroxy-3-methylbut-2-en-1-yl diphosphate synthase (flavodoxin) [Leptospiraceae bacterium]|nr:MAG: 4-hydroxy-3-methylbut-2-en-1-yl diphosphate synthase (flavodoxin) [Leptospiraceae bacterium]
MEVKLSINDLIKEMIYLSRNISYTGKYTLHPYIYKRFPTRKVKIGNLYIGGDEPIRIQSMTTTPTLDINATVKQTKQLFDAGCEIVRITTRNPKEAKALKEIKEKLLQEGYNGPIVADVHFSPQTALIAVDYADKVRINPGNFVDTKKFEQKEYTDEEYEKEILKIHDAFLPLIQKLKEQGKSLRIGANHGSLSDRIMNRFGDTPEGMVESAIEFIKIAEYYDFKDIIISMKASNPFIMIQAYKMLVERFLKENMNYPIHLGVTEAGDGKDGRIKSYAGIGLLLLEGIGDTIRVSLTEDPVNEIPAAKEIIDFINILKKDNFELYQYLEKQEFIKESSYPYEIKRNTKNLAKYSIGKDYSLKWIVDYPEQFTSDMIKKILNHPPDYFLINENQISNYKNQLNQFTSLKNIKPIFRIKELNKEKLETINSDIPTANFYLDINGANEKDLYNILNLIKQFSEKNLWILNIKNDIYTIIEILNTFDSPIVITVDTFNNNFIDIIHLYKYLSNKTNIPFLLQLNINKINQKNFLLPYISIMGAGSIFSSIGDLLYIKADNFNESYEYGSDILQITRMRLSRADFISCPSCGRTLFDLQETTQKIKNLTQHLTGVKIAIMGCIVNGLGEMADADFGYVGASPGKVNLYKGKTIIKRNVPEEEAPQELIQIIKEAGMWKAPE